MDADDETPIYVHATEQVQIKNGKITLNKKPSAIGEMYIMLMTEDGAVDTNKLPMKIPTNSIAKEMEIQNVFNAWVNSYNGNKRHTDLGLEVEAPKGVATTEELKGQVNDAGVEGTGDYVDGTNEKYQGSVVFVDYYVQAKSGAKQIDIEAGKFGGSYYLEASTLFRAKADGVDYPAEFVIPNCKVQSNFTFTMAATGKKVA